jgi:hypothetical protein
MRALNLLEMLIMPPHPLPMSKFPSAMPRIRSVTIFKACCYDFLLPAPKFSACAHHQAGLVNWKTGRPLMKPKTRRKLIGTRPAAPTVEVKGSEDTDKTDAPYDLNGLSLSRIIELFKLKYPNDVRKKLCSYVIKAVKSDWDMPKTLKGLADTSKCKRSPVQHWPS